MTVTDVLPGYSGPVLTTRHTRLAIRRIISEMRRIDSIVCPAFVFSEWQRWLAVANYLKIKIEQSSSGLPDGNKGRLLFRAHTQKWIIQMRPGLTEVQKLRVLIHEIAHWFVRNREAEWLCDERETVYYYEGPVADKQHLIARHVENLVVRIYRIQTGDN